jgi:hypothetical protein
MSKQTIKFNPVAKDLRTPKYAPRVVQSKKIYDRKRIKHDDNS